jgi:hypothetical protein
MTIDKVLITQSNLFYTLLDFYWYLLNNKFVTPAMYVNKFNGVIVA